MDELLPGAVTPMGVVAYVTATHVFVYTMAGPRAFRHTPDPVRSARPTPHLVYRRAA
jgi:hypothetical protein